ncbi:MAG: aminoacyl-histidine dipeptidase [Anaerolineales bacterium]|nr:aminoacyl-histidine dipeptidase [Anaerolineales bacterium]
MVINQILERFEQISSIPRGTKREEMISRWLQAWAKDHGFSSRVDQTGNLAIYVHASPGLEKAPTIILQGHMDMVCEKTPDSNHDFMRDPIHCIREGDWLRADRTTLGADNGIAIAMALVLAEDRTMPHPPLELLFTVEEEIGIGGASTLDPNLISGKTMINLDSEEEGTFILGCAGGKTTFIRLPCAQEALPPDHDIFHLSVSGLQGGHSGADIHKHLASANKILARALDRIGQNVPVRLVALKGGTARNAIARDAELIFACPKGNEMVLREQVTAFEQEARGEYAKSDAGLSISFRASQTKSNAKAFGQADSANVIQFLMALPHGVIYMSASVEGFVETSTNLAVLELKDDGLHITTLQRSNIMSRLNEIDRYIEAVARLAGAEINFAEGYPAWQPNMDSPLLERSVKVYESLFNHKPAVSIIHAGLECGIIGDRCAGLDMISFGPTIKNAHSPDEKLYIPSVQRVWDLLDALLRSFSGR